MSGLISHKSTGTLRIAFPAQTSIKKYEPTNIHFTHEYLLLENLFSTLVETDPKGGGLLPGIAQSYEWEGDDLILSIRPALQTARGLAITASDVVFSLKRLLVLSANTHGNFKDLVCPGQDLKTVDDPCGGIAERDGKVILKAGKRKSFLLPMLAAIDFAIIPRSSVDPSTLKIVDFGETSGPYFVSRDAEDGALELKMNPRHYHASESLAQSIKLVPVSRAEPDAALSLYKSGLVDHIMTFSGSKPEDLIAYGQDRSDTDLHVTMKIQNITLVFTDRGRRELSPSYRRYIGQKAKEAFSKIYARVPGYQSADEFFPAMADGGLSKDQHEKIVQLLAEGKDEGLPFRLGFLKTGGLDPWLGETSRALPQAQIYFERKIPALEKYANPTDEPHAVIVTIDSGFSEDISLISYSMNVGIFGLKAEARSPWLAKYMDLPEKVDRLKALRELHFDALAAPDIVPLAVSPYVSLARKPWKQDLSDLYANNQLWLIHQ